jgi:arylsulfatase A-like enzyme
VSNGQVNRRVRAPARASCAWSVPETWADLEHAVPGVRAKVRRLPGEMTAAILGLSMGCARAALCSSIAVAALAAALGCQTHRDERRRRGSVILISVDTLRADRLNAYGYRKRETSPEIDRLAQDGILFEHQVTASPWTTPAHLSLLTSLSPTAHGVTTSFSRLWIELGASEGGERLADEQVTLAEVLARHGYDTAAFTGGATLDPRLGFDQGFQTYDTSMFKLSGEKVASLTQWIDAHRDVPFFLFWHTFEVHAPYLQTLFVGDAVAGERAARLRVALVPLSGISDVYPAAQKEGSVLADQGFYTRKVCSALYDGGVRSADFWIGQVMKALKRAGLYQSTLIVLTSDHGEQLGEGAKVGGGYARDGRFYNAHGHDLYAEMIHVPLIIKLPDGKPAGRRVTALSRAIDVMPTILDVLGLPSNSAPMQGTSLRPLWQGRGDDARQAVTESLAVDDRESKSLSSARYAYIVSISREQLTGHGRAFIPARPARVELYDLAADPAEHHDLLVRPTPEAERVAAQYDRELRRLVTERIGRADSGPLDSKTIRRLEALGYVEPRRDPGPRGPRP